jgi:hypothetical protein
MTDSDFNLIPAVESLQNVPSLTPAKQREQRKRQPNRSPRQREPGREQPGDSREKPASDRDDTHSIDYCA